MLKMKAIKHKYVVYCRETSTRKKNKKEEGVKNLPYIILTSYKALRTVSYVIYPQISVEQISSTCSENKRKRKKT